MIGKNMGYDLLFKQAMSFHNDNQLDKAEYLYRQILETVPNNPDVLNLLGLIAQAKNIHIEAVSLFYKAIKEAPNHAPFHFNLAISLDRWGKPFEAVDSYLKAVDLKPDLFEAYNNIATIYLNLGKNNLVEDMYVKSLNICENPEALSNLSYLKKDTNSLLEVIKKYPDDETAFYFLSLLYKEQNDLKKALEYIEKALEISPFSEFILLLNANIYTLLENDENAQNLYEKAIEINPYLDEAITSLADIKFRQNLLCESELLYKQALDINPSNVFAHINYGNLLYHRKQLHQALEQYRSAVILDANMPEISNNIAIIQRDLGQYEEALGLFFNALSKNPQSEEFSINVYETILLMFYERKVNEAKNIAKNWLKSMPDNVFAKHLNSALNNEENSDILSEYAQKLFDNFAKNYEKTLKIIEYKLIDYIKNLNQTFSGKILDIGCGTGLLGEVIKHKDNYLVGIDISKEMIKLANDKNIYDELGQTNALSYLELGEKFDYIFALDVFGYVGDFEKIIDKCQNSNLYFSIELLEKNEKDFILYENGRYKHSKEYVLNLLKKYNFQTVQTNEIIIRIENNTPVLGMIISAR